MNGAEITAVISHMGHGGAQRVLSLVANNWASKGRRIEIVTLSRIKPDAFRLHANVIRSCIERKSSGMAAEPASPSNVDMAKSNGSAPRRGFPVPSFLKLLASFFGYWVTLLQLRTKLKVDRPKLVLSFIAPTNVLAILACLGLGLRLVISERNDPGRQSFGFLWDILRKRLYRKADLVTANSRSAIETLSYYVPSAKLAYLPNPVMCPTGMSRSSRQSGSTILAIGRLERQKGYDVLLHAFRLAGDKCPGWTLTIAGDGSLRTSLQELTHELGLSERVRWLGYVDEPDPLYARADIFVLPSRYEGTPNALIEAMSAGVAPIVTDCLDGALEFVEHDVTGKIVSRENPVELSEAIQNLIHDPELRFRLGQAARLKVQSQSIDLVMPAWEEILFG